MTDTVERAVDEAAHFMAEVACPDHMSDAEAAEFYDSVAAQCEAQAIVIRKEMHSTDTELAAIESTEP